MKERKKAEPLSSKQEANVTVAAYSAMLMHHAIEEFSIQLPKFANMASEDLSNHPNMCSHLCRLLLLFRCGYTNLTERMPNPLDRDDHVKVAKFYSEAAERCGVGSRFSKRVHFVGEDGKCDGSVDLADMLRELDEDSNILSWILEGMNHFYNHREGK